MYEFVQMTMMTSVGIGIATSLHLNSLQLAYVSSAYYLSLIIFIIPAGLYLDRCPLKIILGLTFGISIIGTYLLAFSYSLPMALIARFLSGIGGGFAFLSCMKFISTSFSEKRIKTAIGVCVSIAYLGGILSQAPLMLMIVHYGWRAALILLASIGVISCILNLSCQKISYRQKSQERLRLLKPFLDAASNKNGVIGTIFSAVLNLPIITLGAVWGTIFLINLGNLTLHEASTTLSIFYASLLLSSPIVGAIADRVSSDKAFMITCLLLLLIATAALIFMDNVNVIFYYLEFLLLGVIASSSATGYGITITNNKPEDAATATSLTSIVMMGGGSLFKIVQGAILNTSKWKSISSSLHVPIYTLLSLKMAIGLIIIVTFITLLLVILFFSSRKY